MTIDQIIHLGGDMPQEITVEDKTTAEQLKLLQQLDEEDRKTLFRIIDTMITKKKFKDFLKENVE